VLAIDEKRQIQALDRTQPGLPLKKGRAGTMTHDYKRNGTTTLFAALDIATGKVIGECLARHRADEFLAFLRKIDRETPTHLDLHLILDNYATHKTPAVKRWLARHERGRFARLVPHRRFSFPVFKTTLIFPATRLSALAESSGTPCTLPRSSTGCWCCVRAAFELPRRIFPSDSRGIITGTRARSDR
jgi:DDE superfamily endonuclease